MSKNANVIEHNDGICVIETERIDPALLKKVQIINLIEPIITYAIIIAVMWITRLEETPFLYGTYGVLLIWLLIVSPYWHFKVLKENEIFLDGANRNLGFWMMEARGFGSPIRYYKGREGEKPWIVEYRNEIKWIVIILDILFWGAMVTFAQEYGEILSKLGLEPTPLVRIGIGILLLIAVDLLLIFVLFPFMLRLDNFRSGIEGLKFITIFGLILIVVFNGFFQVFWETLIDLFGYGGDNSFAMRGDPPEQRLRELEIFAVLGQWAGYVFWGFLQQMLFLSIFSTQFSRAFNIRKNPKSIHAVALLSATFFCIIHLPNFWLSFFTFLAGYLWSIFFMKNRNLFIMGFSHGMLGTLGNKLLPISYNVGPSSV
jgi:hypothetical protein